VIFAIFTTVCRIFCRDFLLSLIKTKSHQKQTSFEIETVNKYV